MSYDPETTQPYGQPGYAQAPAGARPFGDADRWALVGLAVSLTVLLACVPGLNCLIYIAPLGVGLYVLSQAKNAVNPQQARTYGWIATGIGILIVVGVLAFVAIYGAFIFSMINEANRSLR